MAATATILANRKARLLATILITLSGCASIVSGRRADVAFDTYPANAHVTIHDRQGRAVSSLRTPGTASLKRQGKYFMPARYTATISAPGYQSAQVPIGSTLNPWILGNIAIGGVPGLVIDNATGAAWKPKRSEVHQQLLPLDGAPQMQSYSAVEPGQQNEIAEAQYIADQPLEQQPMESRRR
jgi:uncharacterized protein YceK